MTETDSALLYERFKHGDRAAFEALVLKHRQSLILFIHRFVQDIDAAEDLAEDVFVKLLIKKPRYTGDASFKTWLFTAGRNISIDYLRKHRHTATAEEPLAESANDVEDKVLQTERKRALYRALDKLPDDEKLLMHLIYIEDLGYDHAEKVLKVSKSKLYAKSRRAKETLKAELIKEGIEF